MSEDRLTPDTNERQDIVSVVVRRTSVNAGMLFAQARRVVREHTR